MQICYNSLDTFLKFPKQISQPLGLRRDHYDLDLSLTLISSLLTPIGQFEEIPSKLSLHIQDFDSRNFTHHYRVIHVKCKCTQNFEGSIISLYNTHDHKVCEREQLADFIALL